MPFSLDNRVALVTGSSRGLGKAIAMMLGRLGAKVAINYANDAKKGEDTFAQFRGHGYLGTLARADVTDPNEIRQMYETIRRELGPVEILVCNATCDQPLRPVEQYDWDFCQRMVDFFIKSPFLLTRICLPHMKGQRWGRIINVTSEVFDVGTAPFTAYVAAKGGQIGFSRSLATELAPFGITVNMVAPGWIPVERHANVPQEELNAYLADVPAGRFGTPEDVAAAVAFYASDEAAFLTGQSISVNGGNTVG